MANKSLTDLTARTATADSDLIHVNSGGTDYKQSKINFVQGGLAVEFATDRLLTSQVDDLPRGSYFGIILSLGHTTETGVPQQNASYYVHAFNYSDAAGIIYLTQMNNGDNYYKRKYQSAWEANWTKEPTRGEITSLNNSLANSLVKNPSNIASYNEFDALATSGGFYAFRLSASFTIGDVALPNYGRGLIMNYSSSDSSFIYVSPDGFWYGFKNSGTWRVKRASTF